MIVNIIKDLFEHGQYQAILDWLTQTDTQAQVAALSEPDQIELSYYHSCALTALGHFQQGLQEATTVHMTFHATNKKSPLLLASLSAQVRALNALGEIDDASQLLTEGDALLQSLTVDEQAPAVVWIPAFELTKGIFLQFGRNLSLSFASLSQALTSFEKLDSPSHLAETLQAIGYSNYGKGEHDTALEYFQRSLALYEKLEHNKGIANVLLYMGFIYLHKGEINTMVEYSYRSLTFAEASGCPVMIAGALRYIGQAHYYKSEFDTALGYSQRALALSESIGDKSGMHDVFAHLGLTHYMIGELDQALDYFQRGLTLNDILQDDFRRGKILTGLIRVTLACQDRVQAQTYLTDLQTVAARNPDNRHMQFRSSLMEALVSKASPRMSDKVHAQMLLRQLVTEENFEWRWQLAMLGLLHLCDLLIFEVRATGEGEAWDETKTFLEQFYTRAQDKKYTEFKAEALLLQAKFALIDGELQQAQTYLTEAKTVATKLNRSLLVARVEAEQTQLITDFTKWTNLIQRNASLQERLTEACIEEYLQKAKDFLIRMS